LENVKRAISQGLKAIHFEGVREFQMEIKKIVELQ